MKEITSSERNMVRALIFGAMVPNILESGKKTRFMGEVPMSG
jgi:hypothetical protein